MAQATDSGRLRDVGACSKGPTDFVASTQFGDVVSSVRRIGRHGAVAQLGERRNGIAKVRGSIPLGSTTSSQCDSLTKVRRSWSADASASAFGITVGSQLHPRSRIPGVGSSSSTLTVDTHGGHPAASADDAPYLYSVA